MTDQAHNWTNWVVAPTSGFEVDDKQGEVGLIQLDPLRFRVSTSFRFRDERIEKRLQEWLPDDVGEDDPAHTVKDALSYEASSNSPTDLASVPPFLRWYANSYGVHTLAAIIHDELIVDVPNGGALGSDIAADYVFREMMRSAGVGWLKRWVMWTAVAARTRWVAGGLRQISVALWAVLALVGITTGVVGAVRLWNGDSGLPLLAIALVLGLAAAPLWGKQIGAGFFAMVAGLFLVPAGAVVLVGLGAFRVLDIASQKLGAK